MLDTAPHPRSEVAKLSRVHVAVLHSQQLVVQTTCAALTQLDGHLVVFGTTSTEDVLATRYVTDVLLAEQDLLPPSLPWREHATSGQGPSLVVLGRPQDPRTLHQAVLSAVRGGAAGWIAPDEEPRALVEAVHNVAAGHLHLPPEVAVDAMELIAVPANGRDADGLTAKERTVLELLAAGRTSQEIAELLLISMHTVRTHRQRLYQKLDIHSALEAAQWLHES